MIKKYVYHYCSVNTFYAIISNQTIRLSDVSKSNDSLEILWIVSFIKDVIGQQYNCLNENIKRIISMGYYNQKIDEKVKLYFEQDELKNKFYFICFSESESRNFLSQWRGYGDNGNGVAIGISEYVLNKIKDSVQKYEYDLEESYILYDKVIYDSEEQKERIKESVQYFWEKLNQEFYQNEETRNKDDLIKIAFEEILLKCFSKLYQEALFMKNPFFAEENESRLVMYVGEDLNKERKRDFSISDKKYYIRDNQIVSYYEIEFGKSVELKRRLLGEIVLGPKNRMDSSTVMSFLNANGFGLKKEKIRKSQGSYR